jgi:two-component system, OmpR family, osmolarity sensor histidine kinase EnvZ
MSWPRSLLARNALLIAGLVIVGQLVSLIGFVLLVQMPRAVQLAEVTARYVSVLESSIASAPTEARATMLSLPGYPVARIADDGPSESAPRPAFRALLIQRFETALAVRLDGRRIRLLRAGGDTLWIELRIPGDRLWFSAPVGPILAEHITNWMIVSAIGGLIGLVGGLMIQRRINRPLDALGEAARQVGSGLPVRRLDENGPRELAEVSRTFNRMVGDLAHVDRERALMLAGISHDVRTPLTRIRLATELMRGKAEPELMARIDQNLDRVDRILGQFLAFARDESIEAPAYTAIGPLLRDCAVGAAGDTARIAVEIGPIPDVLVRPLALGRAIDNLLRNAIAHGGGKVSLRVKHIDDAVEIEVHDDGPGIPEAEIERLRQPFQRGETDGIRSTGLGLAIADRIARLHGGGLRLARAPEGGFSVVLSLPVGAARSNRQSMALGN